MQHAIITTMYHNGRCDVIIILKTIKKSRRKNQTENVRFLVQLLHCSLSFSFRQKYSLVKKENCPYFKTYVNHQKINCPNVFVGSEGMPIVVDDASFDQHKSKNDLEKTINN